MATTNQDAEPADHHYVPKFYLKGFTDKHGSLWVYEHGKNAPRESTPKREGHRPNYYTFRSQGVPDDVAEKALSKAESVVAPTIRKLANPLFKMESRHVGELYAFVALTYVRVPAYRDFLDCSAGKMMKEFTQEEARKKEEFFGSLKEYEGATGNSVGDYEKFREFLLSDRYTVTQGSAAFNLFLTFQSAMMVSEVFKEYKHDTYYAPPGTFFLTGDNPIVTMEPDFKGAATVGMGVGRPRTEVIFPLNKRACLLMRRYGKYENITASTRQVDQINTMIMNASQKFAYAPAGYRRLARIFNDRGCKTVYGKNALIPDPLMVQEHSRM